MSECPLILRRSLMLPAFSSMDEFAQLTGLSTRLLYCLSMENSRYYSRKYIPKKNGDMREIFIPSYTLWLVQRWILINILNKLRPSDQAMAFREGTNYGHKQNAFRHAHTLYGLSLDLKDFFPSITANKVYTLFSDIGYNNFAATILTNLCTLDGKLPQGSTTSPAISNLVCITLDKRLMGLCAKRNIMFTRYADDMYFSCDNKALLLKSFPIIKNIISDEGFFINNRKTHFHTPSNAKRITGITVSSMASEDNIELKAQKSLKRKVRSEIFNAIMSGNYDSLNHIKGEISYIAYIENLVYLERIKKYICNIASKIVYFPELVDAYNRNLFFKDMPLISPMPIDALSEEDLAHLGCLVLERKAFLKKNNIVDICLYNNSPNIETQSIEFESEDNLPF